jgi:uncharacterized delta-60 repeat protein
MLQNTLFKLPLRFFFLSISLILIFHAPAFARAGDLDPTFDGDGIVTRSFSPNFLLNPPTDIVVQPDGKIIFASTSFMTINGISDDYYTIIRYNADGSLDTSFGNAGVVNRSVGNFEGLVTVLLQPDGKIILSGERYGGTNLTDFAVLRHNADGTPDNSFDGNGLAVATISNFSEERYGAAALQPDGKIVVVGQTDNETNNASYDWSVVRFNANGSLDTSFDGDGKIVLPMGGDMELAYSVAIQDDGKIVVSGVSSNGADNDFTTVRLNADGSRDSGFGTNGVIRTQFGNGNETAYDVKIQSDQKIVAAGGTFNGTNSDIAVVRFNPNGTPDSGFGTNGLVTASYTPTSSESALSLVLQPDGKILVSTKTGNNAGVVRFNHNGTLDASFGTNGKVSSQILNFTAAYPFSMALQNDGKILISGSLVWLSSGGPSYYFIARYTGATANKGVFDFDGDGKTDISIFRPSNGEWWINRSSSSQTVAAQFGSSTDKPVPADFSGDGKTDIAFFRPSTGEWFILRSEDSSFYSIPFGTLDDIPVPADYDGDGKADPAVYRPSNQFWYIQRSGGGTTIAQFGAHLDKPVPADFDGDGKTDIAIFRPSDGSWWYVRSTDNQFRVFSFGVSTDRPVPGDYTGDGRADLAVFRPATGEWFFQRSEDNSFYSLPFGAAGDVPAPGDYDGDGRFDTAVFRPAGATWYVDRSSAGLMIQQFGLSTDSPVPAAFVP